VWSGIPKAAANRCRWCSLKEVLSFYSDAGGWGDPTLAQEQAVNLMLVKIKVISAMYHLPAPPPGQFCVYALECSNGNYYIGQSNDLMKRSRQHLVGNATQHKKSTSIKIAYYEVVASRELAVYKELEWKSGFGRARQPGGFPYEHYFEADTAQKLSLITETVLKQAECHYHQR